MENPPPMPGGWPSSGTKRSHTEMMRGTSPNRRSTTRESSHQPSTTTAQPVIIPATNNQNFIEVMVESSSASSSGSLGSRTASSSATNTPPRETTQADDQADRPIPLRLPSFRELDEGQRAQQQHREDAEWLERISQIDEDIAMYTRRQEAIRDDLRRANLFGRSRRLERLLNVSRGPATHSYPRPPGSRRLEDLETIDLTGDDTGNGQSDLQVHTEDNIPESRALASVEQYMNRRRERRERALGDAQRAPRFANATEVIDLSDDDERPQPPLPQRRQQAQTLNPSLEVEFLRARAISPRRRFAGATPPAHIHGYTPPARVVPYHVAPIEILDDNDDDIQIIRETIHQLPSPQPQNRYEQGLIGYIGQFARANLPPMLFGGGGGAPNVREIRDRQNQRQALLDALRRGRGRADVLATAMGRIEEFVAPEMDFGGVGFDLGIPEDFGEAPVRERQTSPDPVLDKVPEGFTRNPVEEDVLICPRCGCELSAEGDEVKRQVWLSRKCGHIYCGTCASTRNSRERPRKAARGNLPLKQCVVEGCTAKTGGKSMLQLFL